MKILAGLLAITVQGAMIDGAKINWSVAGKGDKTVVLVHCWTCDSSLWSRQVAVLARKYQVVTLDLPGHGKSGMPKSAFSMDLFAKAVEGVRRDVHVDKMILVGHSMGTPVIRQYARLFPQHVQALVFADGMVIDQSMLPQFASFPDRFKGPNAAKAREEFIRGMFTPAMPAEVRAKIERMMTAAPDATALGSMEAMTNPEIWKEDGVRVPVLAIYAEESQASSRALLEKIFPGVEYNEIPGTDHFLMLEKPAEFNRILMEFVDRLQ